MYILFKHKNKKIFRYFVEKLGININQLISLQTVEKNNTHLLNLLSNNQEILEILITEVNFSYKVKIDTALYNYMNYNFNFKFSSNRDGNDSCINMNFINNVF